MEGKSILAGSNTFFVGNAVIHVHHVDGKKGRLVHIERGVVIEVLDVLEDMHSVLTPMISTIERNQWIKDAIQVVRGSSGGALYGSNDAPEGGESFIRGSGFVNFRKAIEVWTNRSIRNDSSSELVRSDLQSK